MKRKNRVMKRIPSRVSRPLVALAALLAGLWVAAVWSQPEPESAQARAQRAAVAALTSGTAAGLEQALAEAAAIANPGGAPRVQGPRQARELQRAAETLAELLQRRSAGQSELRDPRALLPAYDRLSAADLLFRERFRNVRRILTELQVGPEIWARLEEAEAEYEAASRRLLEPLAEPLEEIRESSTESPAEKAVLRRAVARAEVALEETGRVLAEEIAPTRTTVLRNELPYRPASLAPRSPRVEPAVTPSYLDATGPASEPADLAASPGAPLSPEIVAQAAALGHDYVRIFEFVRNEIRREWYAGGMKGAEETLRQGAGNDVDQASLLIALFRASSLPARYVHGVIERPVEELASSLGLGDPAQVPGALTGAGIAHRPVVRGGRLAALEVEHTWVAAHLPYTNYRGAVVDFSGRTWLPLMPAVTAVEEVVPTPVLERMGFSTDAALTTLLAAPQAQSPRQWLRQQVESWLLAQASGETFEDQLGSRDLVAQRLGLLPSSLPVPVVAVTGESAALEPQREHRVRFVLRTGDAETDAVLMEHEVALRELLARRLTLSYMPASVDDHRTVNAFGGLDAVPVYLVRLRPRLRLGGRLLAQSEASVAMGARHRLEVEILAPGAGGGLSERVAQSVVAGSYRALAFGGQRFLPRPDEGDDPADTEGLAARLLSQLAARYGAKWDAGEDELAALFGVSFSRPLPALAISAAEVVVESALGLPVDLAWQGVSLDAAFRAAEPVARDGDPAAARDWMRLAALEGSALEHRIFEGELLVSSISADKGLGLARQAGQTVLRIDATNLTSALAGLAHPSAVLADVEARVLRGQVVEIPVAPVRLNAWLGSTWRAEDPATGAAAYLIAGGLAGGATTEPPGSWILDFLADALEAPYSAEPNTDPLAGVEITKLSDTDAQEGEVDSVLPLALAVRVRDAFGRPVHGAEVSFTSWSGGGRLISESGAEGPVVTATTDRLGIARVRLRLGQRTVDNPTFVLREPEDEHLTRVLGHVVEATVPSSDGILTLEQPLTALGFPGDPEVLRRADTAQTEFLISPSTWADTMFILAEDRFSNPVSNVEILFEAGPPTAQDPECSNLSSLTENAVVFDPSPGATGPAACDEEYPLLGDCGVPSFTGLTTTVGARAGVIAGNSAVRAYVVFAGSDALSGPGASAPPLRFGYGIEYANQTAGQPGPCNPVVGAISRPEPGARLLAPATRVGTELSQAYPHWLLYWEPDFEIRQRVNGELYYERLETGNWNPLVPRNTDFTVTQGGEATATRYLGDGGWETSFRAGATPGLNIATFETIDYATFDGAYDDDELKLIYGWLVSYGSIAHPLRLRVLEYWGVLPEITAITPDPITLTDDGRTSEPITVEYSIAPAEYQPGLAELALLSDGEISYLVSLDGQPNVSSTILRRGLELDLEATHEVQLILNRGTPYEVRSDAVPLPLFQNIFRDLEPPSSIAMDVDLLNQRSCPAATTFGFGLNAPSQVWLEFFPVDSLDPDGEPSFGVPLSLLDGEVLQPVDHDYLLAPSGGGPADLELPPGDYRWRLRGISTVDGHEEMEEGFVSSEYTSRDALPVGHTLIEGVDLFNGHLGLSYLDLDVPGRGAALSLQRTYSSNAGAAPGPLGIGWSHSYESKIVVTACGEVQVIGGEGSGMRFVDDGQGGLRPLKGYHGTLLADPAGLSFDFYSKAGMRHHYGSRAGNEWSLDWIEDPNGNRTTLSYAPDVFPPLLLAVADSSGRTLRFHYEAGSVQLAPQVQLLTRIEGPVGSGLEMRYAYDGFGNLVRAERETHADGSDSRVQTYDYALGPGFGVDERHLLLRTVNEVSGAETAYAYDRGVIGLVGGIGVPRSFVSQVTRPEGGVTSFTFDTAELADPSGQPELATVVTDARSNDTTYTFDRYGSLTSVVDAENSTTTQVWAAEDVLLLSRTDANGATTDFTYDEHGNLTSESVVVTDHNGASQELVRSLEYWPQSAFDRPGIKNRVRRETDRRGTVTELDYDPRGNLVARRVLGTDFSEAYTYLPNGDRATRTDARDFVTLYAYDAYGNLASVTDPEGGVETTEWNVRSLAIRRVDELGRETNIEYDTLDRPVRQVLPRVQGESTAPVETWSYDDPARRITVRDAAGRATTTTLDREGRIVHIQNAEGGEQVVAYDGHGNKILESEWFDASTARADVIFTYDRANRLTRRDEALGRVTTYDYDAAGNVVRETLMDAAGAVFEPRATEYDYDQLNRQIRVRSLLATGSSELTVRYDGGGNKIQEIDPLGRSTSHEYDPLGRLVRTEEPEWTPGRRKVTRYDYDAAGNLLRETRENEPEDQVRELVYDSLGRLVEQTDAVGETTRFEYDAVGNLTRQIDPRLNVVEHAYDARDRQTTKTVRLDRVTRPARSVVTRYRYDVVGNRVEDEWPNGNRLLRDFDDLSRQVRLQDDLGPIEEKEYDARSRVTAVVDARGNRTETDYDLLGRAIEVRLPEDRVRRMSYDVAGNRLTETDPRGHVWSFEYDRLDRLVAETDPAPWSYTRLYTYDLAGNKLTETDRRGHQRSFAYDDLDRLVLETDPNPLSYTQSFTYDAVGNRRTYADRRGIVTESAYDGENRLISVHRDGLQIQRIEYDQNGNQRFLTDANGNVSGFEYDERNLRTAENLPLAAITRTTYDDMGDPVEVIDPEGRLTTFGYDLRRRLVAETNNADETVETGYDLSGNRTSMTKGEGNRWTYRYDGASRLVEVEDPLTHLTVYAYDANDNKVLERDAEGSETTYVFDELNRIASMTYPGGTAGETYGYDADGNLTSRVDALGQRTDFTYDEIGRETGRLYSAAATPTVDDLQTITTVYDPNNNPTRITETYGGPTGGRITTRSYDSFDRPVSVTDPRGETLAYGYDANGNRVRLTDPDGTVTTYAYDALNRVSSVAVASSGITEYHYLRDSRLDRVRYPNDTRARHHYDAAGRLRRIDNTQGETTLVSSFEYSFDRNGNRVQQVETLGGVAETTVYAYDLSDRLEEVRYPDSTVSYTYDGVGNRLTEQTRDLADVLTSDKVYTYDARHRLEAVTDTLDAAASATYGFDANGNQTSRLQDGTLTQFLYDIRDQLQEVREGGNLVETYRYDSAGLRIRRAGSGAVTRYVYDQQSVLVTTDEAGATLSKYDYGPDRLLSLAEAGLGRQFYLFDGLGSVVNLSRADGTVQASYRYDAWGNVRSESGDSGNVFGFTGHQRDRATGLYYFGARYYDPVTGRFLNQDPAVGRPDMPPSLHRYLYAFQNPTVYVDPDGRANEETEDKKKKKKKGFFQRLKEGLEDVADTVSLYTEAAKEAVVETLDDIKDGARDFADRAVSSAEAFAEEVDSDTPLGAVANMVVGVTTGVAAAGAEAVGAVAAVASAGAKVAVIATTDSDSELAQEAAEDLAQVWDSTKETVKAIAEDPIGVGTAVVKGAVSTVAAAAQGDAGAIAKTTRTVADVAVGSKGIGAAVKAGKAARAGAAAAQTAKAASTAAKTAKAVNRANRTARAAQRGRASARTQTPPLRAHGQSAPAGLCFVAGTLVATESGPKPIEEVALGEKVWSRHHLTGETGLFEVVTLFRTPDQVVYELEVQGGAAGAETLGVTAEHPFWVVGRGWTQAADLSPGDSLVSLDGRILDVAALRRTERRETVYNFEVAEAHTYFVGEGRVLAHNTCRAKPSAGPGRPPVTGGGAQLENLTRGQQVRIQQVADRHQVKVTLVGSRARLPGGNGPQSDFDFIVEPLNSKIKKRVKRELPRGQDGGEIGPRGGSGQDFLSGPVRVDEPFITFFPKELGR